MTIMMPAAAHETSHGITRVSPGSVRPIAAATSATPRNTQNERGRLINICAAMSGGGMSNSSPCAMNTTASST